MAAYRRIYDSHLLQADCQEPLSAPEPYTQQSSMVYLVYSIADSNPDAVNTESYVVCYVHSLITL